MTTPRSDELVTAFQSARRDPALAVLEGFHAIKHALRFGAQFQVTCTRDMALLRELTAELAPDLGERLPAMATEMPDAEFRRLASVPHETGIIAIARRPPSPASMTAVTGDAPLVLLDDPSHLGNVGATIRVAAAARAAGVMTLRGPDPWHPTAIRGAAGLHFALPVWRVDALASLDRPVIAVDPEGEPLEQLTIPDRAVLAFGSERAGLSADVLGAAAQRIRIPMRDGVSSLNLATAVAVMLYHWRLQR